MEKHLIEIVTKLRNGFRELFIKENGPNIPPIAYQLSPKGGVTIIPSTGVTHKTKQLFWNYVRNASHIRPTAAMLLITHATLKARPTSPTVDGVVDLPSIPDEVLVSVLEPREGPKEYWVAFIYRATYLSYTSLTVDEWKQADSGGSWEPMFAATN